MTRLIAVTGIIAFLAACTDPPKKKEPEKPDPPLTGRQAFQRTFPMARIWSLDAQPLQMQSYNLGPVKSEGGKAGAWIVTYVSPSKLKSKQFTWSAIEAEGNLHKGVFAGLEQSWSGPSSQSSPFGVVAIRTDSDEALKTAMLQKDTVAFAKKHPEIPVTFLMEHSNRFADVVWRVMWGETVGTSEYTVFVDASTGKFLEKN